MESSFGEDRDGDGELIETETPTVGVVDNSTTKIDTCPGVPSGDKPATCASQGLPEFPGVQPSPRNEFYVLEQCIFTIKYSNFKQARISRALLLLLIHVHPHLSRNLALSLSTRVRKVAIRKT